MDYWKNCIDEAFEDAKITASKEQIDTVVSWVEGAHENYDLATGYDCVPNPVVIENEHLKHELVKEQNKVICENCKGKGYLISYNGTVQSESDCGKCNGRGWKY